ncbi:MAG: transketolase [Chlamydiia bacterium]|nr:transketolase [Chlamydiia bacterium]
MDEDTQTALSKIANTIRHLSIDGVQKANSGHPGLPMGCAELGAYLYGIRLRHNPRNSRWVNRDRFILSAGHGSMFLYSCLHLAGFDLPLEELKRFRQLHSKTPGHPEFGETDGVETTTGPLGQGLATAVGQALGLKLLAERFNTDEHKILDSTVYTLAGDGCIMEGITSEASSLAGHLQLNNLVVIYDANNISLDGPLSESCSEDVGARYRAYGWDVFEVDGHDFTSIHNAFTQLDKGGRERPALIIARTVIGQGSPNKAGTHKVHGSPLGPEEVAATKEALGLPAEDFYVPQSVKNFFEKHLEADAELERQWHEVFDAWAAKNPDLYREFEWMAHRRLPDDLEKRLDQLEIKSPMAGRSASSAVINLLAGVLPQIYGGSADLSCSDSTYLKNYPAVAPGVFTGRNIKYGVREFAMAAMASGLAQTGMITPFIGTFLTFSDYMRNAIRLAALMHTQVVYQFTHDSIFLGEDGPTHQPVEHYAALRAMPRLHVFRPADANEVKHAWLSALKYEGPTAIILTRQSLPELEGSRKPFATTTGRGGYVVQGRETGAVDYTLAATGSEVSLAIDVADALEKRGKTVRVISMPCWELFDQQSLQYRRQLFGPESGTCVAIEAGVDLGWHKYVGRDGITITQDDFGASAPASELAREFGFTVESILDRIL